MDFRWTGDDINRSRTLPQELVGLQPDIIATSGTPATVALQRETRTIPIIFASLIDPVASGVVARLNRPSGNITGFANELLLWRVSETLARRRTSLAGENDRAAPQNTWLIPSS
jgi:ABC-type uncharacterized transport system substrate-binding protein